MNRIEGIEVQQAAEALNTHPLMLSRRRKEAREGWLKAPELCLPRVRTLQERPPESHTTEGDSVRSWPPKQGLRAPQFHPHGRMPHSSRSASTRSRAAATAQAGGEAGKLG